MIICRFILVLTLVASAFTFDTTQKDGALRLRSFPGSASVWVDGRLVGATPGEGALTMRLSAGQHRVRVTRVGYHDIESRIDIRSDMTLPASVTLTPQWDFSRDVDPDVDLHLGRVTRRGFEPAMRKPVSRRHLVREAAGTRLILSWSAQRFPIHLEATSDGVKLFETEAKVSDGSQMFVMPAKEVEVVVTPADAGDAVQLGLTRYTLLLSLDACPVSKENPKKRVAIGVR